MMPNVFEALGDWQQPVVLKTSVTTSIDFVETTIVTGESIDAVVQPTKLTTLNTDTLDWSREHFTFHSGDDMKHGQFIEYKGRDFKIVDRADYSDYGYFEAVGEETKAPLLQVTQ